MSEVAAAADGVTAGMLLRHAREAAGLHVDTLAANLKVDAQPVLDRLPQSARPRLRPDGPVINEPFRSPGVGPGPGLLEQVSRPVIVTVALLLFGALALVFLPMLQGGYQAVMEMVQPDAVVPPSGAAAPEPATPMTLETVPAGAAAAPAAPASAPVALQAAPAIGQAPVQGVASTAASAPGASAPASAAQAAVTAPADGRPIVSFRTKGASWVQVTDATGTTVFRKLMEPGESAGASGTRPLSVTVGSVGVTEVQVRGKPYNMTPVAKDNVARFEVK
jgi:cytoskeleton protein RodZ